MYKYVYKREYSEEDLEFNEEVGERQSQPVDEELVELEWTGDVPHCFEYQNWNWSVRNLLNLRNITLYEVLFHWRTE